MRPPMGMNQNLPMNVEGKLGPAMLALANDRQRAFVTACCTPTIHGDISYTDAAIAAGYGADRNSAQVQGSRLAHDERVQAAMLEESQRRFGAALPTAVASVIRILTDPSAKAATVMKAAGMIFDRSGMHTKTEHSVTVTKNENQGEKIERAVRLAQSLGLDPVAMLKKHGFEVPASLKVKEISGMPESSTEGLEDFL